MVLLFELDFDRLCVSVDVMSVWLCVSVLLCVLLCVSFVGVSVLLCVSDCWLDGELCVSGEWCVFVVIWLVEGVRILWLVEFCGFFIVK